MVVIVRWLLKAGKYSCVSGSMVDRWLLLQNGSYSQVSKVVSGSMADRWLLLLSGCCRQVSKLCFW